MKRVLTVSSVCAVLLSIVLAGQAKPSFSGTWKLVSDAAAAGAAAGFVISQYQVTQDDKVMTITATSDQMGEFKTTYNVDGSEGRSPLDLNGQTFDRLTKSAWDGNKLVLTSKSEFNGQSFETKQVWSLGADGTLTVEATRPDFQGGAPTTTKATYKKS